MENSHNKEEVTTKLQNGGKKNLILPMIFCFSHLYLGYSIFHAYTSKTDDWGYGFVSLFFIIILAIVSMINILLVIPFTRKTNRELSFVVVLILVLSWLSIPVGLIMN